MNQIDREIEGALGKAPTKKLKNAAELMGLLGRLHDREPDGAMLAGLCSASVNTWIDGLVETPAAKQALDNLQNALADLPEPLDEVVLDILAAEYADIYLNHSYRLAPTGSVWLTDEHLERQEPMFAVREMYENYGIEVPDWRLRSDDHLVHELQFVAHLCKLGTRQAAEDAANFLDLHVLNWLPKFCQKVTERARVPFFIATAEITGAWLEELRDMLEVMTGIERPKEDVEDTSNRITLFDIDIDRPYAPGVTESW